MEKDFDDDKLASLLKENSFEEGHNRWFANNVLHNLPERRGRLSWVVNLAYLLAALAVVGCWVVFLRDFDWTLITRRILVEYVVLMAITVFLCSCYVWRTIKS